MIVTKKITLTPAQIYALFVTPYVALAAPPAGYVNNILGVSIDKVYNTLAYAVATTLGFGVRNMPANAVFQDGNVLAGTADYAVAVQNPSGWAGFFSTEEDFIIQTDATATTGNSDIIIYITYELKILS
jgi:hypothetical protein